MQQLGLFIEDREGSLWGYRKTKMPFSLDVVNVLLFCEQWDPGNGPYANGPCRAASVYLLPSATSSDTQQTVTTASFGWPALTLLWIALSPDGSCLQSSPIPSVNFCLRMTMCFFDRHTFFNKFRISASGWMEVGARGSSPKFLPCALFFSSGGSKFSLHLLFLYSYSPPLQPFCFL